MIVPVVHFSSQYIIPEEYLIFSQKGFLCRRLIEYHLIDLVQMLVRSSTWAITGEDGGGTIFTCARLLYCWTFRLIRAGFPISACLWAVPSHHISCKQRARFLLVLVRRQKYSPKLLLYVYDRWLLLFLERKKALRKLRFLFVLVVILPVVLITRSSGSQSHARADNPIQHIIFIVKENHTFDNYLASFRVQMGQPSDT